jgi:hypothetical protein
MRIKTYAAAKTTIETTLFLGPTSPLNAVQQVLAHAKFSQLSGNTWLRTTFQKLGTIYHSPMWLFTTFV